ncbi:MAG: electron transfer flavoprotein subunit beta/FixA family protein [Candidatus Thermoplasmatota archaeon]|nr:electron transfer flavoprotein subunit beta/FixA family protein [Candidatus Thermoplasmatota archaeon]
MDIIVCIKQVPDTNDVKIDPKTGTLIREGVPSIVNPDDKHAVEEAIQLKERYGGKVTAISMGPPQALAALREVFAMGVDETILLSDRAFAGADTWATSYSLAMAIKKLGRYDIVFCGREAIDGDTAQIGPQLADSLDIPQVTYVKKVEMIDNKLRVERAMEDSRHVIEIPMPALLTVIKDLNEPRYPRMARVVQAHREHKPTIWNAQDVGADQKKIGLTGSPTQVKRTFAPEPKGKGEVIDGANPQEKVKKLVDKLKEKNVVRRSVS